MAKREFSSTLRNLKFMQRAPQKEEITKKEEEVKKIDTSETIKKKCVVIMEGDPHPGATFGRMSFQSFNPSIDKLNEKAANTGQPDSSTEKTSSREDGSSPDGACSKDKKTKSEDNGELKRKQSAEASEPQFSNKSPKNDAQPSPSSGNASSNKQPKREKLDWRVLRPPKPQKG